jgi:tetratricopeptide (TPR) repeat protein
MSVLYKALQKAQKENEQRQPAAVISENGGAATSAMRLAAPSINWRLAGIGVAALLAIVIGGAFFLLDNSAPAPVAVRIPPPAQPATPPGGAPTNIAAAPQTAGAPAAATPNPAATASPTPAPTADAASPTGAPATTTPATPAAAATPSSAAPAQPAAETKVADAAPQATEPATNDEAGEPAAPLATDQPAALTPPKKAPAKTAERPAKPAAAQPMPQLAADSPARVLSPPIAIKRDEYDFSGVGDAVQVRRVSQQAQDNVGAGYNALVRGDHEMALGFYERALQQEPRSILAQLGRGAALQKMGRSDEARVSYERVLKIDPQNREALTNLTMIVAEREPGEALKRLQTLERDYPSFSPVKAQIGLVYAKLGQFEPALDYLRRAVSLTPEAPMYNYNLALVLDRLNRHDQAVAIYERVLASAAVGRLPADIPTADIERRVRFLRAK